MKRIQMMTWMARCAAVLFLGSALACQSDKSSAEGAPAQAAAPSQVAAVAPPAAALATQAVTAVGQNYCPGCALKKKQGAAAQCSVYGHRHAFKVESAQGADGQPVQALAGETLHYLDNDQSAGLLKGEELHNARVEIKGKLFAPERTLEVSEVKAL